MKAQRVRVVLAIAAVTLGLGMAPAPANPASLTVETVGGRTVDNGHLTGPPLGGTVEVTGIASAEGTEPPAPAVLVADAGDSPLVDAGEPATLLGAAFGGTAPYTFAWTASGGTITEGAGSPTARLDTTGLPPGRVTATLQVTDATGATATDTVVAVIVASTTVRLVDQTRADPTPGVVGVLPATLDFPFTVTPGTTRIDVTASWTLPTNDYDLVLIDPSGSQRLIVGDPPGVTSESATLADPETGTWIARVDKFATVTDTVRVVVDATGHGPDPRPSVDAGGPYRFLIGASQHLDGTVTGGTAPVSTAWDLDGDGRYEAPGTDIVAALPPGRHLVTLKATDAGGLERRQTTSVLVADPARLAEDTTALTVVAVADSGINPYHLEFSAETYPDPDVLALTNGFTRHPSEYIAGFPADAAALPITLGQGYFPPQDAPLWTPENIVGGKLYWIPGTKIIGALDSDVSTGANAGEDPHPILDDNGHGTGSASVSTGNRYGYCPTCLLVVIEGLEEGVATTYPWVDISSHSFGYQYGVPLGLLLGPNEATRDATERGQTVLFAAGNGIGNAFDVPIATYGSDQTGPDWNITVGAIRRDNQRGVVGDGIPVHLSAWGDGNLPSACRTGTVGQCAFGGTSAATPYTAGVFGTVLTRVRDALGDGTVGQREVGEQGQVVAEAFGPGASVYLADGLLTRAELREAVLKTAVPLQGEPSPFPYPVTAPYNTTTNVLIEGYGAATPESARRAVDVLLGRSTVPDRSAEDGFFAIDRQIRDTLYGGYDRNGDGEAEFEGLAGGTAALGLGGLDAATASTKLSTVAGALEVIGRAAALSAPAGVGAAASATEPSTWYLHRRFTGEPGTEPGCSAASNELYLDQADTAGDIEPCFESRITSIVAAYRPLGIWASTRTLGAPLPAGSHVAVDLYLTTEVPALVRPTGVLMATDREIGEGEGAFGVVAGSGPGPGSSVGAVVASVPLPDLGGCAARGEACWTRFQWSFTTTRPAFPGEQLTFQVQLVGTRAWSFGYEGAHASSVTITPAPLPTTGFEFGATIIGPAEGEVVEQADTIVAGGTAAFVDQGTDPTGAGDHPAYRRVELSLDDPAFGRAVEASYDSRSGAWSVPLRGVAPGSHTLYARARDGAIGSPVDQVAFTVRPHTRVEWQVVDRNATLDPAGWRDASGFSTWRFSFDAARHGSGPHTVAVRVVSRGLVLAEESVRVNLA